MWTKAATTACVVVLASSAVAIAGPISFVDLVVPHLTRGIIGVDYRWILPGAAVLGAAMLMWAYGLPT
ncbi:iron chelate uptake ABC transporter family permease subunit [Scytonema sp. NUACC26]|uniref:iron chelate uptake ABC transporter family permease subunit n=1 Tax=Scytonema sp. NUACC26 TaxID=3140176 RepID=UPI0034DC5F72